jgi:hypothetical protein
LSGTERTFLLLLFDAGTHARTLGRRTDRHVVDVEAFGGALENDGSHDAAVTYRHMHL